MKKVGYILRMFPKISETYILDELNTLNSMGVNITIFSLSTTIEQQQHPGTEALEDNIINAEFSLKFLVSCLLFVLLHPFLFIKNFIKSLGQISMKNYFKAVFISRIMRKRKINHIHSHFADYPTTIAELVSRLSKKPYSFTAHTFDIFVIQDGLCNKIHRAKFVITDCEYNKNLLKKLCEQEYSDKIHIVHPSVNTNLFSPIKYDKPETFNIISKGQLIAKKGFRFLLAALSLVKDRGLSFKCIILGKGSQKSLLEKLRKEFDIEDEVEIIMEKTRSEVLNKLSQASLFVLPSIITRNGDRDSIPISLVEAMSMEIPVIASDIESISELVTNNSGTLIKPKDYRRLAWEIEQYIKMEPHERQLVGKKGREIVIENFNIDVEAEKLARLFQMEQ